MASAIIAALGKLGITVLMSFINETLAKRLIIHSLEKLCGMTKSDFDDTLVKDLRVAWNVVD